MGKKDIQIPIHLFFIDIGRIQSIRLQEHTRCYGGGSRPWGPALALKRGTTEQEPAPAWGTKRIITHCLMVKTPQKNKHPCLLASSFMFMFAGGQSLKNGVDSPQPNRGWKPGVFDFVLSGRLRSLIFSLSMVLALEMRSRRCLPEQAGAALQLRGSQLSLHIVQELGCLPQAWVSTPGAQAFGSY